MFPGMRLIPAAIFRGTLVLLAGCNDSEQAWSDVINKCASSDVVNGGDAWTYMGITNTAQLGSVWDRGDKGLDLRFDPSTDFSDPNIPQTYIQQGVSASCVGSNSVKWTVAPDLILGPGATTSNPTFKADIDSATTVSVSVKEFRVDELKDFEYLKAYKFLDASYYQDLTQDNRYVANLAVWVSGLAVTMDFSDSAAAQFHKDFAKTNGVPPLSAGLSASWSSQTQLTINLTDKSSILAERFVGVRQVIGTATDDVARAGGFVSAAARGRAGTPGLKAQTLFSPVDLSAVPIANRTPSFHPPKGKNP